MSPAPSYSLHGSLGYRITLLARINERGFEERLAPIGLTRMMWCLLLAVREEGLSNPSEMAAFVGIDRTAASRCLRQMQDRGLISRKDGRRDRRRTVVALTAAGHAALDAAIPAARANAGRFLGKLTDDEHRTLDRLIAKLMADEARGVARL